LVGNLDLVAAPPYQLIVDESERSVEYGDNLILGVQITPEAQLLQDNEFIWSTQDSFECVGPAGAECTEVLINPTETQIVRLRFRDERGCEQRFSIPVFVDIPNYIYIPNAFSPNGDGSNDEFTFFVTDFVQSVPQVQVFNRWGGLVYEVNDLQTAGLSYWDGRHEGQPVNAGVYIYKILLELVTGEQVLLSGDVTVVR